MIVVKGGRCTEVKQCFPVTSMVTSTERECKAVRRVRTIEPGVFNSKVPTGYYKTDLGIQDTYIQG